MVSDRRYEGVTLYRSRTLNIKTHEIGTRSRFFFTTTDEKSLGFKCVGLGLQVHHKAGCCHSKQQPYLSLTKLNLPVLEPINMKILLHSCLILEATGLLELHDLSLLCTRVLLDSNVTRFILEQLMSVQREKWVITPLISEFGTLLGFPVSLIMNPSL